MKVIVSACLMGRNCKYNGGNNRNEKIIDFLKDKEVIEICPEVMGGLSIPRCPVELVNGIAINRDGVNVDEQFHRGAEKVIKEIEGEEIAYAILQSRSPSCGPKQIYDGSFSKTLIQGQGIAAKALAEKGIQLKDSEEFTSNV